MDKATPKKIKDLRKRHGITQVQLADSLYGIKRDRIADWESGRRGCPPLVWWAAKLLWDGEDIREGAKPDEVQEALRRR